MALGIPSIDLSFLKKSLGFPRPFHNVALERLKVLCSFQFCFRNNLAKQMRSCLKMLHWWQTVDVEEVELPFHEAFFAINKDWPLGTMGYSLLSGKWQYVFVKLPAISFWLPVWKLGGLYFSSPQVVFATPGSWTLGGSILPLSNYAFPEDHGQNFLGKCCPILIFVSELCCLAVF